MVTQLGAGGQFEGFRVATKAELDLLATHSGITPGANTFVNFVPVQTLLGMLGCTMNCGSGNDDGAYGKEATVSSLGEHDLYSFQLIINPSGFADYSGNYPDGTASSLFKARRRALFEVIGHTPDQIRIVDEAPSKLNTPPRIHKHRSYHSST